MKYVDDLREYIGCSINFENFKRGKVAFLKRWRKSTGMNFQNLTDFMEHMLKIVAKIEQNFNLSTKETHK